MKHGLTGEGLALGPEDVELVQQRLDGYQADFRPASDAGKALVRRMALLSVRLDRCAVYEAAAISAAIRSAEADFDDARQAEVERLVATIADSPTSNLRRLMRMPEGVDRLIEAWVGLREDLEHGEGSRWGDGHGALALSLTGRKPGGFGIGRAEALSRAVGGDFSLLSDKDGAGLDGTSRREWAREALLAMIGEAVAKLEAHRETLDREAIEADRAGAASRALFDPSKEACLARKYEAAAVREMQRSLKELKAVEAETAGRAAASPPAPARSLGSFSAGTMARVVPPAPAPSAVSSAPKMAVSGGSSYVPIAVGRAPNESP